MTLGIARESGALLTTASAGGTIGTSCGINGRLSGSGTVTQTGSSTRIRLDLFERAGAGDLTIGPAEEPKRVAAGAAGIDMTLGIRGTLGFGTVTITEIRVTNNPGNFEIRDPNICLNSTLSAHILAANDECKIRVFAMNANEAGEVTIRYTRPEAAAKTVRVAS